MSIFQIIIFFVTIILFFISCGLLVFYPRKSYYNKLFGKTYNAYNTSKEYRKNKLGYILFKIFECIIALCIIIFLLMPYLLDIPSLITGNLNYVTGYVSYIERPRKHHGRYDGMHYVHIAGKKLNFYVSEDIEEHSTYKLGYLPHTLTIVSSSKLKPNTLEVDTSVSKRFNFPIEKFVFFIIYLGVLILLFFMSRYLRFKLLMVSSIIFYPITIYLYIKCGYNTGIWFSSGNSAFICIILSVIIIFIGFIAYFIESAKTSEPIISLFFIQLFSVAQLLILFDKKLNLLDSIYKLFQL